MADTRINALSTATSSASDDYVPIDGTTNGTRKLSAYSPSFGGNATVGGTLSTVGNATVGTSGNAVLTLGTSGAAYTHYIYGATAGGAIQIKSDPATTDRHLSLGSINNSYVYTEMLKLANTGVVTIPGTTASTTTSSGALVVGNGTSGGLGVGGNIYGGGNIVSTAAGGRFLIFGTGNTTESKELTFKRSDDADNFTLGLTGSAYAGSLSGLGNNEAYLYNSSASAFRIFIGTAATNRFDFTQSQFKINPTTASTGTSSGALVVSGGVGVAGAIYAGGLLNVASTAVSSIAGGLSMGANGTNNGYVTINGAAGGLRSYLVQTAGVIRWRIGGDSTAESGSNAGSDFHIYSYTDAGAGIAEVFKITRSNSAATFAGSITTGTPSGGTAAAWKLGTVASVSPTSPNRTIEVEIGGTTYYLHAKTTNN